MPNHCDNRLVIVRGDKKAAKKLIRNSDNKVDFGVLLPMPPELLQEHPNPNKEPTDMCGNPESISKANLKKYGAGNWYDWANKNWGTKWNAYGDDDKLLEFGHNDPKGRGGHRFTTAWGPPIPWLLALSKALPKHVIGLYYDIELGNGSGYMEFGGGKITKDEEDEL